KHAGGGEVNELTEAPVPGTTLGFLGSRGFFLVKRNCLTLQDFCILASLRQDWEGRAEIGASKQGVETKDLLN
ncbi:hypothetical protein MKW92_044225, partial [Papaver armeniacum]